MLHKLEPSSTFCNILFQFATLKFVTRQVEHLAVIQATTRSTCNATMLQHKLSKNVARITGFKANIANENYAQISKILKKVPDNKVCTVRKKKLIFQLLPRK